MPSRYLIVLLAIVSTTTTACAQQPAQSAKSGGNAATQSPAAKANLVIRKAVYGNLPDGTSVDVTDKVRAMVKNGALSIAATDANFGDPYNGVMKLTIIRAEMRAKYMNFGGLGGAGDITDRVKQFQDGNRFYVSMKSDGDSKITVYYKYGDGKTLAKEQAEDGSINIVPPTKLRVDFILNGVDLTKTVDLDQKLEISAENK